MPNVQTLTNQYKLDLANGVHLPAHDYKVALFTSAAVGLDATLVTYTGLANEVANGNGYATGGKSLLNRVAQLFGSTAVIDWDDLVWIAATFTARYAVLYNNTLAGKNVIAILDFGVDKTASNGNFTLDFPAPGAATSLIRIP